MAFCVNEVVSLGTTQLGLKQMFLYKLVDPKIFILIFVINGVIRIKMFFFLIYGKVFDF